jgi:hypothetical protein
MAPQVWAWNVGWRGFKAICTTRGRCDAEGQLDAELQGLGVPHTCKNPGSWPTQADANGVPGTLRADVLSIQWNVVLWDQALGIEVDKLKVFSLRKFRVGEGIHTAQEYNWYS